MKKFVAAFFALALIATLSLTVFAATGINQYEQAVLDRLASCSMEDENGKIITVPEEYINAARNYFLGDFEMTAEQMNTVMAKIDECLIVVEEDVSNSTSKGDHLSLSGIDKSTRDEVLNIGKEAADVADLKVSYNAKDQQLTITNSSNNTVFVSSKPIKTTGEDFPITTGLVIGSVAVVLVLGTAVMIGVSKKAGLLVK